SVSRFVSNTNAPKRTRSPENFEGSITSARESLSSMSLIRASFRPCCSLAAWYSAFSFRSPCSRATPMAREIFGRSSLRRTSSSRSFCAPAGVMGTGSFILPRRASLPVVSAGASLVLPRQMALWRRPAWRQLLGGRQTQASRAPAGRKAAKSGPANLRPKRNAASRGLEHADNEAELAQVDEQRPRARNFEPRARIVLGCRAARPVPDRLRARVPSRFGLRLFGESQARLRSRDG